MRTRQRIVRTLLTLFLGVTTAGWASAQTGTITGRVLDSRTLQPVSSAQVFSTELSLGALSRDDGRYVLVDVPAGTHTISVQRIGYRTTEQTVTVGAGETVTANFDIAEDALALDAVVVTGTPGGTRQRAIGNVVGRVQASEITEIAPVATMQDLLGSREAGLSFHRQSGNIGTGSQIRIRGVSSISMGSQPLIYVDGVRVDNEGGAGPAIRDGRQVSKLDDFNPEDIESIEIIKGPAAATLYGTEASAGVIQIITKKGSSGTPQFDVMVRQGTSWLMNPSEKIGWAYGLIDNADLAELDTCAMATVVCEPGTTADNTLVSFNIWESEKAAGREFFDAGHLQAYSVSMRGGSDLVRYFLSTDWEDNTGIVDYNWNRGMSLRANVSVIPSPKLVLDVSTGYIDGTTSFMQQYTGYGVWEQAQWANPLGLGRTLRGFLRARPEEIADVEAIRENSRFTGSATVTHTPWEWLTQRLIVGTDVSNDENTILFPRQPEGSNHDFGGLSLGDLSVERPNTRYNTADYAISLRYGLLDNIALTTSVGGQYYARKEKTVFANGRVFPAPAIRSLAGAASTTSSQTEVENKSFGAYIQQEAAINDRIFLTAAVRGDDNSAFGADYDAAIYPKLSAAWVVSEEPFWRWSNIVNSLRLRSAWGQAGRQPDVFAAVTLYAPGVGPGGNPAVSPDVLGNPDLGPEVSTELELGFDAAFFNDRLSSTFTYYTQNVEDALVSVPVPTSSGFPGSQSVNLGELSNRGWELSLDGRAVEQPSWALDIGGGLSFNRNRIEDLGGLAPTSTLREGWPYPAVTSRIILDGDFDESGVPINLTCDGGVGDDNLRGGAPVPCSEAPEVLLSGATPEYEATFNTTLTLFRNLSLYGLFEWRGEHYRSLTDASCRHTCFWTSRAAVLRDDPTFVAANDNIVENADLEESTFNASFAKLREVSANYVLPDALATRMGASRATINIAGRNLWTLWVAEKDINGAVIHDPEARNASSLTGSNSNVPPLASFLVTLRMSF